VVTRSSEQIEGAQFQPSPRPPAGFEGLCQGLLREAGFVQVEVPGRSGDVRYVARSVALVRLAA